jgi:hypothetical protein
MGFLVGWTTKKNAATPMVKGFYFGGDVVGESSPPKFSPSKHYKT